MVVYWSIGPRQVFYNHSNPLSLANALFLDHLLKPRLNVQPPLRSEVFALEQMNDLKFREFKKSSRYIILIHIEVVVDAGRRILY